MGKIGGQIKALKKRFDAAIIWTRGQVKPGKLK
jgi:hypothetical protein